MILIVRIIHIHTTSKNHNYTTINNNYNNDNDNNNNNNNHDHTIITNNTILILTILPIQATPASMLTMTSMNDTIAVW